MKNGKYCILIADDEKEIRDILRLLLEGEGYAVLTAEDGREAIAEAAAEVDLYILDVNMPEVSGFPAAAEIRKHFDAPIVFLTAYSTESDKVMGFSVGADDYIVKPFEPKELVARVKAVLRRYEPKQEEDKNILKFGELEINLSNYSVLYHGKSLDFPPKEFELLSFLAQHPNRVFTREQLLDRIWGYEYVGDTRTVDVHVKRMREKLNSEDEWGIRTVWSVGYKFGQK